MERLYGGKKAEATAEAVKVRNVPNPTKKAHKNEGRVCVLAEAVCVIEIV